jgi:hypothetical protein
MNSLVNKAFSRVNSTRRSGVISMLAASLWLATTLRMSACTVFSDSKGEEVLAARNWDMTEGFLGVPVMWTVTTQGSDHGRICFGRHDDCEDGMNDQGLFVAIAATPPNGGFKSRDEPVSGPHALNQLLAQCATVDDAIRWWKKHPNVIINCDCNRREFLGITGAYKNTGIGGHILMADKRGNSVVCEWEKGKLKVIRKAGRYQLITNFLLSKPDSADPSDSRFAAGTKILDEAGKPSIVTCVEALKATSTQLTRYSVVYDLAAGNVHVYYCGHFEKIITFHLNDELKMGAYEVRLDTLFAASKK